MLEVTVQGHFALVNTDVRTPTQQTYKQQYINELIQKLHHAEPRATTLVLPNSLLLL